MAQRRLGRGGMDWRYARVGLVILVGLALVAFLTYRVGLVFDLWRPSYEVVALFPQVTGLSTNAAVSIAGRRVGRVEEIELIPPEERVGEHQVLVRLSIGDHVREQIRADSRARLRLQGLLGDRVIDIEPGSPRARVLSPGDTLPTIVPIELEEHVLEPLATILGDASVLVRDMRVVAGRIAGGEGTLGGLIADDALYLRMSAAAGEVEGMMREIRTGGGTLHRLIHDPALYDELQRALARFDALGREITEAEGTLGLLLRDDELYQRMMGLLETADTTVFGLGDFVRRLTEDEGTIHRLLEDPELYDQLLRAVVDFQHLIMQIRGDPRQFRPEVQIRLF